MDRIYLYVPPEEYAGVEAYGASWDEDAKCWYVPEWKISRNGPARFRVNGPTLHGLPAEPRFESFTRPFSLMQVFEL
jgi:hypothetical protein